MCCRHRAASREVLGSVQLLSEALLEVSRCTRAYKHRSIYASQAKPEFSFGFRRSSKCIIAVPSLLQEQQRSVVRYREQLMRNRRRAEARGRALALTQGILALLAGGGRRPGSSSNPSCRSG